jgi:ribosomal protein S18 acetylase RimI-like enzyme
VSEIRFRSATAQDVDALIEFWESAGENESRPADRPELVARLLRRDPEAVVVADIDGAIVGTIICGWDGWRGSLYRLAVAPAFRRRGIGRRLLGAAEERLAALGAERFHAMVLNENEQGHSLWQAAGYEPQQDWRRWVKPHLADIRSQAGSPTFRQPKSMTAERRSSVTSKLHRDCER